MLDGQSMFSQWSLVLRGVTRMEKGQETMLWESEGIKGRCSAWKKEELLEGGKEYHVEKK